MLTMLIAVFLQSEPHVWRFEDGTTGKIPAGWSAHKTGEGTGSVWQVVEDATSKNGKRVLAQTSSEGPRPMFNLCVADQSSHQDIDLSVAVRAVQGTIDRGGGPVWRYQDANNYFICRWNPLEENFRVYTVIDGRRTQLATVDVKLPADTWHVIRVVHVKDHIRCYLDGASPLDVRSDAFPQAGKVGLWSKADAVTHFDDLSVGSPKQ
jgi:hypothetical protein